MNNPLISINISCYNRKDLLRECIKSFINQTYTNWELILADDGSEEDLSFVSNMDDRIKYYRQEHGGMAKGLNLAKEKSNGKYVAPFGSDDIALPDLLQKTYDLIESDRTIDVVYTDCWTKQSNGNQYRNKHPEYNQIDAYQKMLEKQYISHGGTLWKKEKYPEYDGTLAPAEDWDFFLKAMENNCKFKLLPERLWIYNVGHEGRMTNDKKMDDACEKVLNKRGYTFDKINRIGKLCS